MKSILFYVLLLLPVFATAQASKNGKQFPDSNEQNIDSLLLLTHHLNHQEGNVEAAMETAFEALKLSEKINYERGLVTSYYTISVYLSDSENFEKSIEYIEKASKYKEYLSKNNGAEFNLLMLQASNMYQLGFTSMAASHYHKAEKVILKAENDPKQLYQLMILYMQASLAYADPDSQYRYFLKAKSISKRSDAFPQSLPHTERLIKKAEIHEKIGSYHLEKNNIDSARHYYNTVLEIGKELKSDFAEAIAQASLGLVLEKEQKLQEALEKLNKAEEFFNTNAIYSNLAPIYKAKQRIYAQFGNTEKEKEYLHHYKELSDRLENVKNQGRDKTIINLVNQKEKEIKESEKKYKLNVAVIALAVILFLLFGWFYFKRYKVRRQKQLQEKDIEISKKEQEFRKLKRKVNESFEEIIQLAKENKPEFFARFQEVYPDFRNKMLTLNPQLKPTELTLAAYIYIGLNTKDIAEYTFKAVQTIKNNKRNLRKRLGIPTEENLSIWLRNYLES